MTLRIEKMSVAGSLGQGQQLPVSEAGTVVQSIDLAATTRSAAMAAKRGGGQEVAKIRNLHTAPILVAIGWPHSTGEVWTLPGGTGTRLDNTTATRRYLAVGEIDYVAVNEGMVFIWQAA